MTYKPTSHKRESDHQHTEFFGRTQKGFSLLKTRLAANIDAETLNRCRYCSKFKMTYKPTSRKRETHCQHYGMFRPHPKVGLLLVEDEARGRRLAPAEPPVSLQRGADSLALFEREPGGGAPDRHPAPGRLTCQVSRLSIGIQSTSSRWIVD